MFWTGLENHPYCPEADNSEQLGENGIKGGPCCMYTVSICSATTLSCFPDKPRQHIRKQRHYFANKGPSSQSYGFSSGQVWIWELDLKEGWAPQDWCFWTVVLEKTLERPLDCKEIHLVNRKGSKSWILIGRTDAEVETRILWPPDTKSWLIRKDPDPGKDWRQEEKGTRKDKMVWWHLWLNGHALEQALGDGEGQGALVCCSPWGHKESDSTEWLDNSNPRCFPETPGSSCYRAQIIRKH